MDAYPPEMRVRARELRAAGLSYRAVAAELGITHPTVIKWLNPAVAARAAASARAWEERTREERRPQRTARQRRARRAAHGRCCARCERPCDGKLCRRCFCERRSVRIALVHRLWMKGVATAEIARRMQTTRAAIGSLVQEGRRRGIDFPRRRGVRRTLIPISFEVGVRKTNESEI